MDLQIARSMPTLRSRHLGVLLLTVILVACDDGGRPQPSAIPAPAPAPAPTPPPEPEPGPGPGSGPTPVPDPVPDPGPLPPPPGNGPSVSGVVYVHGPAGRQRLAGFRFSLVWDYSPWDDYPTTVVTDEFGRYAANRGEPGVVGIAIPDSAGYHAPCPAGFDNLAANRTMDIHVVPDTTLTTTGVPSSMPTTVPRVSGTVFERTSDGKQPVVGATVFLNPTLGLGEVLSVSLTDAEGTYLVCAAPPHTGTGAVMELGVSKAGYDPKGRQLTVTGDNHVNLELTPR
jgi:hypothetical protein